jgi:predicted nucleic-acid-binding protein
MIESTIITFIAILLFVTGMAVQKYLIDSRADQNIPKSFIKSKLNNNFISDVILDETKVVLKIDTSNLEKKTELVGETIVTNNDTTNAINKLKNMKGK